MEYFVGCILWLLFSIIILNFETNECDQRTKNAKFKSTPSAFGQRALFSPRNEPRNNFLLEFYLLKLKHVMNATFNCVLMPPLIALCSLCLVVSCQMRTVTFISNDVCCSKCQTRKEKTIIIELEPLKNLIENRKSLCDKIEFWVEQIRLKRNRNERWPAHRRQRMNATR